MDIGALLGRTRHRILFPFRLPAPAGVTTSQNIFIGPLVMAGSEAHRWLAPGSLRLAADWRTSLTTTMRVVHWIHHRAAHMRAAPQIARASRLADAHVLVIEIAHLAHRRDALEMDGPLFAGRQAHDSVIAFLRHQLRRRACAADDLPAAPFVQLDVVDDGAGRDIAQGQRVAHADIGLRAAHHTVAHLQAIRREDVALFAVNIVQQRDTRRAVRIILNREDLRRNAEFVALEINDAIAPLHPTATMPGRDVTLVVAASTTVLLCDQ